MVFFVSAGLVDIVLQNKIVNYQGISPLVEAGPRFTLILRWH